MVKKRTIAYVITALAGLAVIGGFARFALRPYPTRLAVTARAEDDTVVVNQMRPSRLNATVMDQFGRALQSDTTVRYQWLGGDSIELSSAGKMQCSRRSESSVRATFANLSRDFVVRCRPVVSVEAATWIDLVVGDSTRDLSFVAHGPDGQPVTELRGTVTVRDSSVVDLEGTTIRPKRGGATFAVVEIGDAKTSIPIMVYQPVKSFVDDPKMGLMAMPVRLGQGDTITTPLPKAAFWVTYFSKDPTVAPPTIEIVGDGACTLGDGLHPRRIEEGQYAKYCHTESHAQMMIAHGASGASIVSGVVAIRRMW